MSWSRSPARDLAGTLLVSLPVLGQTPICPPGYRAEAVMTERAQAWLMRGFAFEPTSGWWYWGLGDTVWLHPDPSNWILAHRFAPPHQIGLLSRPAGQGHIWFTELTTGTVFSFDPAVDEVPRSFPGVTQSFDLAVGPAGEVLVSANPSWPQPLADSGIWHVAPGRAGREILRLRGPSGPLQFDAAWNLLVAEIGRAVPPPAGAVRILRFPRARWQAAVSGGGTLVPADADAVSTGWDGAYDLAFDDLGRMYVTDPLSAVVGRTLPRSLQRDPAPACVLPHPCVQLQFVPGGAAPFAPFQPAAYAGGMLIGNGNFIGEFNVHRLEPMRPALEAIPGTVIGPGPVILQVGAAPASGLVVLAATMDPPRPEWIVAAPNGLPLWLGFDASAAFVTLAHALDGTGSASVQLAHPGGFAAQFHFQAFAFGPAGTQVHGSSATRTVQLLP